MLNFKNNVLKLLILMCCLSVNLVYAKRISGDFSGRWCGDKANKVFSFALNIQKVSNGYKGGYVTHVFSVDRLNDNDDAFYFKATKKNIIITKIKPEVTGNTGLIQLKILNDNQIEFRVLKYPDGEFYAHKKMILTRC